VSKSGGFDLSHPVDTSRGRGYPLLTFTAKTQRRKGNAEKIKKCMNGGKNMAAAFFIDEWSARFGVPFRTDQVFAQSSLSLRFLCAFASLR
jgi:hypothetical protein